MLFDPSPQFIVKLFVSAIKPRAAVALSKAYVHFNYYDGAGAQKLYKIVQTGLEEYDYDKIKPFLILLQHMLEAAQSGSPLYSQAVGPYLENFFTGVIGDNKCYFQWMEVVTDWVIKVASRIPFMREWMQANAELWSHMIDWHKENSEPPMQQYIDSKVMLNKPNQRTRNSLYRFRLNRRN